MLLRLQTFLARGGVASRRAAEALIAGGQVAVNGATVTAMGVKIDPERDVVTVGGRRVLLPAGHVYYAYHKPRGLLVTRRDERGRETIFDRLPDTARRLVAVGRLDRDSEGLLLLTDDGPWAQRIAHPSSGIEKEYHVLVGGNVSTAVLELLTSGVEVEPGVVLRADTADKIAARNHQTLLRLVLHEGRKRHIRLLLGALGFNVLVLRRERIGPVTLGRLKPGRLRRLRPAELNALERPAQPPEGGRTR
ncbi:MAG: pseudouridine synthase [Candidatus Sumerlaeia bacterium]